jgi:hypothetical protein
MKTPREILLAKHQAAEAKLDKIRREVVADLPPHAGREAEAPLALKLWRELILPRPRAWAGVAALWVVIVGLKLATPEAPQVVVQKAPAASEVLAGVRQQKLLFAELVGVAKKRAAVPTTAATPQPRSDRRVRIPIG